MKKIKMYAYPLIFLILALLVILILWISWQRYTAAEKLTINEIFSQVEQMYNGEIVTFETEKSTYAILLMREDDYYDITLNKKDGKVIKIKKQQAVAQHKNNYLSKEAIQAIIKKQYDGTITQIRLSESNQQLTYRVYLTEKNKKEIVVTVDAFDGVIYSETKSSKDQGILTEADIKTIIYQSYEGIIETISLSETSAGGYYLVVIKDDDKTKTLQIHAVSGKILSESK